jgi:2-(1,2-epoxy-1,2-dihydrophenyl)acetyl-CoA isomerase
MVMSHIRTDRDGAVGIITIDRPARFNSLDVRTAQDLRKAALGFARDEQVRTVVLRGSGGVFCSGADLKYIGAGGEAAELGYLRPGARQVPEGFGEIFKQILEYLHSTISEIRRTQKPFIAAVDGIAAAGGLGLALCCDLVFASPRAQFEWAYSRTGLTGAESSTFFLPRLVGFRRAMELILLNPRLDAARALELGLITAVLPADTFDEEAIARARGIAAGPLRAYGEAKSLVNMASGMDRLDYHLDQELERLTLSADGVEFEEGLQAFLGKREPRFDRA